MLADVELSKPGEVGRDRSIRREVEQRGRSSAQRMLVVGLVQVAERPDLVVRHLDLFVLAGDDSSGILRKVSVER